MTPPKEQIDVEKIRLMANHLGILKQSLEKFAADCDEQRKAAVPITGWPTLARGLQFMLDQAQNFVGAASPIHDLSGEDVLMSGQSYTETKKKYVSRKKKLAELAETKPKRNNNRK